jgi:hypothetical protein
MEELVQDRAHPKGWRGRGVRTGSTGTIPPRREWHKNLCGECSNRVESC